MLAVKLLFWLKFGPSLSLVPKMHPDKHPKLGSHWPVGRVYVCCSPLGPQVGLPGNTFAGSLNCLQSIWSPGFASYCAMRRCPCVPTYDKVSTVDLVNSLWNDRL